PAWRPGSRWFSRPRVLARTFPGCDGSRRPAGGERSARPIELPARSCHLAPAARQQEPSWWLAPSFPARAQWHWHPTAATTSDTASHWESERAADQTRDGARLGDRCTIGRPRQFHHSCTTVLRLNRTVRKADHSVNHAPRAGQALLRTARPDYVRRLQSARPQLAHGFGQGGHTGVRYNT